MNSNGTWIGIIGGMGTAAGLEFEQRLFEVCNERGVSGDQNYPDWVYFNASSVPDRTKAIRGEGPDCTPHLVEVLRKAERAGVSAVVVACNTAHYFHDAVFSEVPIPWIHLQREAARFIRQAFPAVRSVGVLATEGTLFARLYHRALEEENLQVVAPEIGSEVQKKVMEAIYHPRFGIKHSGSAVLPEARAVLHDATQWLQQQGAEVVVAGCTELSLALREAGTDGMPLVDPLCVAAETLYETWKSESR